MLTLMCVLFVSAQETVTLKFSSTTPDGSYFPFDVINITNVTRGWTESLTYPDTTMVLTSYDGLQENIYQEGFISEVYPNPLSGTAYVYFEMGKSGLISAKVLSINGSIISEYTEFIEEGSHQIIINMSQPQMAFLVLRANDNQYIKKVLNIDSGSSDNISINKVSDIKRNPKTRDSGEFVIGDIMSYMAVSIVGNNMIESNRITQAQYSDETIILTFPITTPSVSTAEITNISINTAIAGGVVLTDGGGTVGARGVCWSTNQNPTISSSHTLDGSGVGSFTSSLSGLSSNTTYYIRAYATNETGTAYGNQVTFTTNQDIVIPTVTTNDVSNITTSTATCGGNVTSSGNGTVSARGVCWSTGQNPTISDSHTTNGAGTGSFASSISNLTENTVYYVRAYATNETGTAYGEQKTFTTLHDVTLPTVITNNVTNITTNSATTGGTVSSSGNGTVSARGVCWSTSQNPTINNSHTSDGSGIGGFTSNITGLTENTTYYVRAYATNDAGTSYGEQKTFITLHDVTLPTVTTNNVSNITTSTATSGGNVTSAGYGIVSSKGVCWSTNQNPTINDSHTTNGSGTGSFTSNLTDLNSNTTYYVRAYATNETGTAYGNQVTFTTDQEIVVPIVTTSDVSYITPNSAICGGIVTSAGNGSVSARGVCWSTGQNPTISGSHTSDGFGLGSFISNMNNLSSSTTYYVRAYATNEAGTAYGNQITFTTNQEIILPTVTTNNAINITTNSATTGGNVTSSGNGTVSARGVCWGTSQNPTISNSHTSDGTGTGSFTSDLINLNSNTTYYVRAYATNEAGTAYGNQITFTTEQELVLATVTTNDVSNITTNSAICGGNITSQGNSTVTARGICWSTSQNPTISNSHTFDGMSGGSFTSNMTSLSVNTTYYVRAYATNAAGTAYGEQKTFTTLLHNITPPTVVTDVVTDINSFYATCGGNVTSDGYGTVIDRGVCWSTGQNPSLTFGYHVSCGAGTGPYSVTITDLTMNTTYRVRAYATNEAGTSYGLQRTFTTPSLTLPTVSTGDIYDITANSASCNNIVTFNGYGTVTARGVCWSTHENPTIDDYYTLDGDGTGSYTSVMTSLNHNTIYYARAYVINEYGTAYGNQRMFTTDYVQTWTNGILPGSFSISATQQIHFSQGNIQYQASTNTWRFAYNQWDFVGGWDAGILCGNVFENGVQCRNDQVSLTYTGWIDLYGWGSGDIPTVNVSSTISHTYYDWGNNAISNGGNTPNMWRTLTKYEWVYLLNTRSTASGLRYAKATVNDITGVILLPDNWNANYYSLINVNNPATYFSDNVISANDWVVTFEPNGAVFLPITGYSGGPGNYFYDGGHYWSSSIGNGADSASAFYFDLWSLNPNVSSDLYPHPRYAVRLVKINE